MFSLKAVSLVTKTKKPERFFNIIKNPLMELDARSALPVYPVLKTQSHGKGVKTSNKQGLSTDADCKKTKRRPVRAPAIAWRLLKIFVEIRRIPIKTLKGGTAYPLDNTM